MPGQEERAAVSLRDIARFAKVFMWLARHLAAHDAHGVLASEVLLGSRAGRRHTRTALIMSLAYCYHARLPQEERERHL